MTSDSASSPVSPPQFIVSAEPSLLQQIITNMQADASVNVLKVSGPPASPERFVAQMADTKAEELRQAFGERVKVEPNLPYEPFS
jgi:hypothetical protein